MLLGTSINDKACLSVEFSWLVKKGWGLVDNFSSSTCDAVIIIIIIKYIYIAQNRVMQLRDGRSISFLPTVN